ncbi:MAG: UDP-N-acetylmuramoyl-tripeptide--D-alanyl-D-alanine ligase [bacterium]|nr:UDP-N-acetylmuramoyl-tripeptide--D-alanyl-D-alanine ligase [bacterium]
MKLFFLRILRTKLRFLARLTLWRYEPDIVGVTGSVGKTSAKEAIRTVLGYERRVRATSKSFNNELGLPLTILGDWERTGGVWFWVGVLTRAVWQLVVKSPRYPEVLVLEYGVDHPGDMKYLLSIARPHVGVFTAIGEVPVHVEFFTGADAILKEKARLIGSLPVTGFALLSADDPKIMELTTQTRARVVTVGFSDRADLQVLNVQNVSDGERIGISFKLTYGGSFVPMRLDGVLGKAQAYAAALGAAAGLIFGMNLVKIGEALARYRSPSGRLTVLRGIKQSTIIDDSYNASPTAAEEALAVLQSLRAKRKVAVLGDMLELGKYTLESHEKVGRRAAEVVDLLVTVGLRGKFIAEAAIRAGLPKRSIRQFMNLPDVIEYLQTDIRPGDVVLVKASQGVRLEKVIREIMAEPERAEELLVRQNAEWAGKPGLYDEA